MEELTGCRMPRLVAGNKRSHHGKFTGCRIKTTRPGLAIDNYRSHHREIHMLND